MQFWVRMWVVVYLQTAIHLANKECVQFTHGFSQKNCISSFYLIFANIICLKMQLIIFVVFGVSRVKRLRRVLIQIASWVAGRCLKFVSGKAESVSVKPAETGQQHAYVGWREGSNSKIRQKIFLLKYSVLRDECTCFLWWVLQKSSTGNVYQYSKVCNKNTRWLRVLRKLIARWCMNFGMVTAFFLGQNSNIWWI